MTLRLLLPSMLLLAACDGNSVKLDVDSDPVADDSAVTGDDTGEPTSDLDGDGFTVEDGDCDDENADAYPGAPESCDDAVDLNCDGSVGTDDADGDGWIACEECDDSDAAISPDAAEVCDGVDNDCSGAIDDDPIDASTWYGDADADGYGDPTVSTEACEAPSGYVADDTDCDDGTDAVNPGAQEICDGLDNDCDGLTDSADDSVDPNSTAVWYPDADGDGYGDADGPTVEACDQPSGHVLDDTDCDDADPGVGGPTTWYQDADGDGYGDAAVSTEACEAPSGYVADGNDCDDADASATPDTVWYADTDGDGYGDANNTTTACDQAPSGYVADDTDCDDGDAAVSPAESEVCDGIDNNCDGEVDEDGAIDGTTYYADVDGDGYGDASSDLLSCDTPSGYVSDDTDCDDSDGSINPAASEVCDGLDNDCDGYTDDDDPEGVADPSTWYPDADGDGYGDASGATVDQCEAPSGYVADGTDCDDADAAVSPGAPEVSYNSVDDDCNGHVDDMAVADEALYSIVGINNNDHIGAGGVYMSADLNGDGDPELIIGVPDDDSRRSDAGAIAFHDVDNLGVDVDYDNGWLLVTGEDRNDEAGSSLVLLGDVDGDGYIELAMGAGGSDRDANNGGVVWIFDVYGESGEEEANNIRDGRIEGRENGERLGETLAAGDFDGDGGTDLAIGAANSNNGSVYIAWHADHYYSRNDDTDDLDYLLTGASGGDDLGTALHGPGDVDGDGYADLVACAPGDDSAASGAGACYLIAGGASMSDGDVSGVAAASFLGAAADDALGDTAFSASSADIDGDGATDLLLGAPGYDGVTAGGGVVYAFTGGAFSGSLTPSDAAHSIQGSGAVGAAIGVGDVTGDGLYDDVLLGAPNEGSGLVYLWAGGQSAATWTLGGDEAASWSPSGNSDELGASVSGLMDLDGDGDMDFAVSAPSNSDGDTNAGKVYILPAY